MAKEKEVKEPVAEAKPVEAPKEKVHKAEIGDVVHFYKQEQLNSGGSKLTAQAAIVIGLVGAEANMQPKDHAVTVITWGKLGYQEVKTPIRYSEIPAHGMWSKK